MYFATISSPHKNFHPAILEDGMFRPLPYSDIVEVIKAGATVAASHAYPPMLLEGALDAGSRNTLEGSGKRSDILLHAPLHPPTLRDAYAFEGHVKTANKNRGRDVPSEWYDFPVFYFTNPHSIFGPDEVIPYPPYTSELDYELEVAVVIGKPGMDIKAEDAEENIFGYTIFNDWSARDVPRAEMKVGLGPAKGKDFASTLGPLIVTKEALSDRATGRPGVYDLAMSAKVNGVEMSRGNLKDIYWSFGEIIARASQSVMLMPGDVVELEVERIGILRNTIGEDTP